jgi:hypothetical protein
VVESKNDPNTSEPNAVFAVFGLDWFDLWFFYWVGSVLNTPTTHTKFIPQNIIMNLHPRLAKSPRFLGVYYIK